MYNHLADGDTDLVWIHSGAPGAAAPSGYSAGQPRRTTESGTATGPLRASLPRAPGAADWSSGAGGKALDRGQAAAAQSPRRQHSAAGGGGAVQH